MLFPCYVDFWHFWSMLCNILFILVLYGCLVAVCLGVWPSGTCKWVLEAQLLASLVHWSYFTRGHVHHFTWNPGCFYMFIILFETWNHGFSQVFAYVHNCSHVVTCASKFSGDFRVRFRGHRRRTTPRSREWRQNNSPAKSHRKTHGLANWELLTYLTWRVPAIRTGTLQFFGTMAGAFSDWVPI